MQMSISLHLQTFGVVVTIVMALFNWLFFSKSFLRTTSWVIVVEGLIPNLALVLVVPLIPHRTNITCVTFRGFWIYRYWRSNICLLDVSLILESCDFHLDSESDMIFGCPSVSASPHIIFITFGDFWMYRY